MKFNKLPSNSEKLLLDIVQADNPAEMLCSLFKNASFKEDNELRGVIRELRQEGYIDVKWADNVPCFVTLNNSARVYKEQFVEYELKQSNSTLQKKEGVRMIFISHRSIDKVIADILVDFFSATGIPRNRIFCSSLPGNDINEKISSEVKINLQNSVINIAVLSPDYYKSAYCLNEAGILWYNDVPVIPIALPEIDSNNMYGFLNNEYKIRRLDSDTDIAYIYDAVSEALTTQSAKVAIVTYESNKLKERYAEFLTKREVPQLSVIVSKPATFLDITTDDERIVLYYILHRNVRKISKSDVLKWLRENEVYDVNVDNAFDLLSSFDGGSINNNTLEFGIDSFRKYSANAISLLPVLKECVDRHTKKSADTFKILWDSNSLDEILVLFIAYIVEERIYRFGDRWMSEGQIENIKNWESKNVLYSTLSNNYGSSLQFFIQNKFVYAISWTSYGNPREYKLCTSLQDLLFNFPSEYSDKLQETKNIYHLDLPF